MFTQIEAANNEEDVYLMYEYHAAAGARKSRCSAALCRCHTDSRFYPQRAENLASWDSAFICRFW